MKKTLLFLVSILSLTALAQSDCKPYVPAEKGSTWELTNYDDKDKITGVLKYELVDKVENGNEITFKVKCTSFDPKGEETYTNEYECYCKNGEFSFNMSYMAGGAQMEAFEDMEMTMDASDFQVPDLDAPVGTQLADASLKMTVGNNGITMMNMTVETTNRLVAARESLTTEAGTFECVKVSQDVSTKVMMKVEASTIDWYSPNVGTVRSESYNKNGKLTGYSVLTKLSM